MRFDSLSAQAAALACATASSLDLTEASLVAAADSKFVFISLRAAAALDEARLATARRIAGAALSAFDGIPIVIKDVFDLANSTTTAGSATRRTAPVAMRDAGVVARLRSAGMIVIGKCNLSEFAFSGLGLNPHFGTPTPSFSSDCAPGGSSSGTAIAIERGIVAAGLGTDTAGSLRVPAAFNGLVGFRPSQGRYSSDGIFPLAPSFDVPGPMSRNVADCIALDSLMQDSPAVTQSAEKPIFVVDDALAGDERVEAAVRLNFENAVSTLILAGFVVKRRTFNAIANTRNAIETYGWLGGIEAAKTHRLLLGSADADHLDPNVLRRLQLSSGISAAIAGHLQQLRLAAMRTIGAELGDEILLSPTVRHTSPSLLPLQQDPDLFARTNLSVLSDTMVASFLGMPAIAIPSGCDARGLSTSIQFSAVNGRDDALLAAAKLYEISIMS